MLARVAGVAVTLGAAAGIAMAGTVAQSPAAGATHQQAAAASAWLPGLESLPAAARAPVSAALGRDDPRYLTQLSELAASNGAAGNNLGLSAAISGNTIAVGAPNGLGPGAVYVFTEPAGGWSSGVLTQAAELTASAGQLNDRFGASVAVSGGTVVVGAPQVGGGQGAAYVFTEPPTGWADATQNATLTSSDQDGDNLGTSVAISGGTVVAGGPDTDLGRGAAYVFTEPPTGWADATETAVLSATGAHANSLLGKSVAISGGTVVAGAPDTGVNVNADQGAAYVFTEPPTGWASETQNAELTASDGAANDLLGTSVAVSGGTAVAGAPDTNGHRGAVYEFTEPVTGWADATQTATLTASDAAAFDVLGTSVAAWGDTVLAGAPHAMVGSNAMQGAAYIWVMPAGGWESGTETEKLTSSNGASLNSFGAASAFSDGTAVIGAPRVAITAAGQGAAYIFGQPQPPPGGGGLLLTGFFSPRRGSTWHVPGVVPVRTAVENSLGTRIPDSTAYALAGGCRITVSASGARRLAPHCLAYSAVTHRFSYAWRPGRGRAGQVTLTIQITYPGTPDVTSISERIRLAAHRPGRGKRPLRGDRRTRETPSR